MVQLVANLNQQDLLILINTRGGWKRACEPNGFVLKSYLASLGVEIPPYR